MDSPPRLAGKLLCLGENTNRHREHVCVCVCGGGVVCVCMFVHHIKLRGTACTVHLQCERVPMKTMSNILSAALWLIFSFIIVHTYKHKPTPINTHKQITQIHTLLTVMTETINADNRCICACGVCTNLFLCPTQYVQYVHVNWCYLK